MTGEGLLLNPIKCPAKRSKCPAKLKKLCAHCKLNANSKMFDTAPSCTPGVSWVWLCTTTRDAIGVLKVVHHRYQAIAFMFNGGSCSSFTFLSDWQLCLPKSYRRCHFLRSWLSGHLGDPPSTTLIMSKTHERAYLKHRTRAINGQWILMEINGD